MGRKKCVALVDRLLSAVKQNEIYIVFVYIGEEVVEHGVHKLYNNL